MSQLLENLIVRFLYVKEGEVVAVPRRIVLRKLDDTYLEGIDLEVAADEVASGNVDNPSKAAYRRFRRDRILGDQVRVVNG